MDSDVVRKPDDLPIVLYIAGYGRSGSTVMDMMLGSQACAVGLGELARVFTFFKTNALCSCRVPLRECTFWTAIMNRVEAAAPLVDLDEMDAVTRRVEGIGGLRRSLLGRRDTLHAKYRIAWHALLTAVKAESGASIVVDSSKTARDTWGRATALNLLVGADVRAIHLIRDPRAVAWSVRRGSNRKLEAGAPARLRGGDSRAYMGWLLANVGAERVAVQLPTLRMRYEDMTSDPSRAMTSIAEFLSVSFVSAASGESVVAAGHGIAGNRLRRAGSVQVRQDDEWRSHISIGSRALALVTWPLARFYGYTFD